MPLKASLAKQTWEAAWVQLYSRVPGPRMCVLQPAGEESGSGEKGHARCLSIFDHLNLFSLFFLDHFVMLILAPNTIWKILKL